jgi:hypothetical protein
VKDPAIAKLQEDYGKLVEAPELADRGAGGGGGALPRAPQRAGGAERVLSRGLLLSGMQEGSGQQEMELGEVSARAFRVVLRHLYTAEVPAWGEAQGAGNDAGGGGGVSGRAGNGGMGGKGKGKGKGK